MNRKFIKSMSLILILIIISSSIPSFAATFPDVKSSHWAYDYIEEMTRLKYITGYEDGTFKPDNSVNYLENLKLISSLFTLTDEELIVGRNAYSSLIKELEIASWAEEAVVKTLYKGVISETELKEAHTKGLTTTGTKLRPQRLTITVYLAKAMGLEEIANNKQFIVLPYKEMLDIDKKFHKYLSVLLDAGVLNPEGTGDRFFEPKQVVKRSDMAKMLSVAYDYLNLENPDPEKPDPEKPNENNKRNIEGTIIGIKLIIDKNPEITIKNKETEKEETFIIQENADVEIDNKKAFASELRLEQSISALVELDQITEIKSYSINNEFIVIGKVNGINFQENALTMSVTSTNNLELNYNDIINVKLAQDVNIYDGKNNNLNITNIKSGMNIIIFGTYDDFIIIANDINIRQ